jgi:hypothetical protein
MAGSMVVRAGWWSAQRHVSMGVVPARGDFDPLDFLTIWALRGSSYNTKIEIVDFRVMWTTTRCVDLLHGWAKRWEA